MCVKLKYDTIETFAPIRYVTESFEQFSVLFAYENVHNRNIKGIKHLVCNKSCSLSCSSTTELRPHIEMIKEFVYLESLIFTWAAVMQK